jgi:hypothetical protein
MASTGARANLEDSGDAENQVDALHDEMVTEE